MFGRSQGVPVHRWIGFILFKNQSTLKKKQTHQMQNNKLCWDNSVTMRRVGVLTISGRSDLWQPELPPSTPAPDIYIPVDNA